MEEGLTRSTLLLVNVRIPYTEQHAREDATQLMGIGGRPDGAARVHHHRARQRPVPGRDRDPLSGCWASWRSPNGVHPAARRRGLVTRRSGWSRRGRSRRWAPSAPRGGALIRRTSPRSVRSSRRVSPARDWSGIGVRRQGVAQKEIILLVAAALRPGRCSPGSVARIDGMHLVLLLDPRDPGVRRDRRDQARPLGAAAGRADRRRGRSAGRGLFTRNWANLRGAPCGRGCGRARCRQHDHRCQHQRGRTSPATGGAELGQRVRDEGAAVGRDRQARR